MNQQLYLHEQLLLLILRDEKGTALPVEYTLALAGGLMAELFLAERIRIEDNKKKRVLWRDSTGMDDALLNECLETIRRSKKPKPVEEWIQRFSEIKGLKNRIADTLVQTGILSRKSRKILGLFKQQIYPLQVREVEAEIVSGMQKAIRGERADVEPRTALLISLADVTGLLRYHFDRKELKNRKERIKQITEGELLGESIKAIEAIQAAIITGAAAAGAIAATTAATSS